MDRSKLRDHGGGEVPYYADNTSKAGIVVIFVVCVVSDFVDKAENTCHFQNEGEVGSFHNFVYSFINQSSSATFLCL